jgi:hypothetical protein
MSAAVPSLEPLSTTTISRRSAGKSVARIESRQSAIVDSPSRTGTITETSGCSEGARFTGGS